MTETLCWHCSVPGTGGCSWDDQDNQKPVPGWVAKKTVWKGYGKYAKEYDSYIVMKCPLYKNERRK